MAEEGRTWPRRRLASVVAGALVLLALLAGCGGSPGAEKKAAGAPALQVGTWPRYWQTVEGAEKEHVTDNVETYWAGYDGDTIVYSGVDVVRGIDKATGKEKWKYLLPPGQAVCAVADEPEVSDHTAVFGVAPQGLGLQTRCTDTIGVDTTTGKRRWRDYLTSREDIVNQSITVGDHHALVLYDVPHSADYVTDAALDTGKFTWSHDEVGTFVTKGTPGGKETECRVRAGLAPADGVVLGVADCLGRDLPQAFGLDAGDGRLLWSAPFWARTDHDLPDEVQPHPVDARLWIGATNYEDVKVPTVWFDDPRTGHYLVVPETDVTPTKTTVSADDREYFTGPAEPMGRQAHFGASVSTKQVYLSGSTAIYYKSLEQRSVVGSVVVAVSLPSGKRLWRREFFGGYNGLAGLGGAPGLTPDGQEFWIGDDDAHIHRLATRTGREIGRGTFEPQPQLTLFDVIGDDFVLQRGTPGIYQNESGLSLYRWRAARKD